MTLSMQLQPDMQPTEFYDKGSALTLLQLQELEAEAHSRLTACVHSILEICQRTLLQKLKWFL